MLTWWAAIAAATTCDLSGSPNDPFNVPVRAERVRLLLEVWVEDANPAWADAVLSALDERGLPATVVLQMDPPDDDELALLARIADAPHEVGLDLPGDRVPSDVLAGVRSLRKAMRPFRKGGVKARTVMAPIGSKASEAMLGRAGFHNLINSTGPATASPRIAGHLEGQPRINLVIHSGPYEGACGSDPRVGPFTPATADRAARAIQQAQGARGVPIVRIALQGARGASTDAAVLSRWLDEVVLPGEVAVVSANAARIEALQAIRRGIEEAPAAVGGRVVSVGDAQLAAESLRDATVIPRALPGELTPSEAFYAFCLIAAGQSDGSAVRIADLSGPPTLASSSLAGPTELTTDAVASTAKAMLAAMPKELPAAVPVAGRLLTAGELLLALASVVRGDATPSTNPVGVPDPNQRGLGWGSATVP